MKATIITVVYNNERTIEDAISSVLKQSFKDIEYIIIDGNSSDNTLSIINKYKSEIKKIVSEPDQGIYYAMNKGISLATGDIVGILNSDDLYNDNMVIENIISIFQKYLDADVVYGNLYYVNSENINKIVRIWKSKQYYDNFFEDGEIPPHPSFFVKRHVYEQAGLFDTEFKLASDYEFMYRILKINKYKSYYLNKVIVRMRLGGATNNSIKNIYRGNKEIMAVWNKYKIAIPIKFYVNRYLKKIYQLLR